MKNIRAHRIVVAQGMRKAFQDLPIACLVQDQLFDERKTIAKSRDRCRVPAAQCGQSGVDGFRLTVAVYPSRKIPGFPKLTSHPMAGHPAQIPCRGEDRLAVQRSGAFMADLLKPERPTAGLIEQSAIDPWCTNAGRKVLKHSGSVRLELAPAIVQKVGRS